jgi:hypothetical protein
MPRCLIASFFLLMTIVLPTRAAPPCETAGSPSLSVLVEPGEMAGIDRNLMVALYANGCVSVRLPSHYRRAGRYLLLATPAEQATLAQLSSQPELRGFSAAAVNAEIAAANRSSAQESFFYVADADRFTVRIRDAASGKLTTLQYEGATQYAERYPDIVALKQLANTIDALLEFAAREDLVALEPQP